jgi:hypothetical protein
MAENGFMSELNDIVTTDEDGKPSIDLFEINKTHMEGVIKSTMNFIQSLQGIKQAADADLNAMNVEQGEDVSYDDTSSDTGSDSGDEFGMGDMGDEFDMGDMSEVDTGSEEEASGTEEEEPPIE